MKTTYIPELPKEGGTVVNGRFVSREDMNSIVAKMKARLKELEKLNVKAK